MLKKGGLGRKQLISVEDDMKREGGAGVSIALIAGVLIVWFAQTARFKRSMRKAYSMLSYAVIDQMSYSNAKRCRG
jgi:hypothetical protein